MADTNSPTGNQPTVLSTVISRRLRITLIVVGGVVFISGAVAVFTPKTSDGGSVALLIFGAIASLLALIGRLPLRVTYKDVAVDFVSQVAVAITDLPPRERDAVVGRLQEPQFSTAPAVSQLVGQVQSASLRERTIVAQLSKFQSKSADAKVAFGVNAQPAGRRVGNRVARPDAEIEYGRHLFAVEVKILTRSNANLQMAIGQARFYLTIEAFDGVVLIVASEALSRAEAASYEEEGIAIVAAGDLERTLEPALQRLAVRQSRT